MMPKLSDVVPAICSLREELRRQHASESTIAAQTERVVREYWAPFVTDERFWPDYARRAVCQYCDGTGLVVHRGITNRLGVSVDEGEPCRCPLGMRFLKAPKPESDHTGAGKAPKAKPFTRFGR